VGLLSWLLGFRASRIEEGQVSEFTMYERFTDRARKVMQLANQEAQRFNHEYIGTEHILLGIIKEGSGVAAHVLKSLNIDPGTIRQEVEQIAQPAPERVTTGKLPQTSGAKKVIEYSIEEARNLNHNYVGSEHLLLGLLREQEGLAAQVLVNLGLTLQDVRTEVVQVLGQPMLGQPIDAKPLPRHRLRRPAKEYDLYLPLNYPDGSLIEVDKIAAVEKRLHDQFGGCCRFWQGEQGTWQLLGATFQGEVLVLRIVAERGGAARGFLERLKEDLKAELRQNDILILLRDIEIL
jgi:hypothetical protein